MDFRNFSPLTGIFRRDRRTEDPVEEFADQYFRGGGLFPGLYFNDAGANTRRGPPFRMRQNGAQDFDWLTFRGQRLPFEAFAARNSDSLPLRLRLMDIDPAGHSARASFHTLRPDRLPGRTRFIDVLDEERHPRTDNEQGREELLPSLNLSDDQYHHDSQRQPETRRATLSPRSRSRSDRYADLRTQERQFRGMGRRLSTPGADRYTEWNLRAGAPIENALPFGKAMQWLHEALKSAEDFYQKFQSEYDREVKPIKYVSGEMLRALWVSKVSGKGAPVGGQDGGQGQKSVGKPEEQFAEKKKSLREAMEAALNASLKLGEQESPKATTLEARKRLQEKVNIASHHVMELLDSAMKASEHCKALLGELKLLKDLVDTKKNKSLFEEGGGGNFGGGGGQDNVGSDGDGGGYNNDEQQSNSWDNQNQS